MTKIQHFSENTKQKYLIPYRQYCIDSFKLLIDSHYFKNIQIPHNIVQTDADTGEVLDNFKRNSLKIAYKNTTIFISTFNRYLKNKSINKVVILFSSKVAEANYFTGIQKHHVIDVLNFLKETGRIDFDDVQVIYKNLYTKDLDVKCDYLFNKSDRDHIIDYQKELKHRFQFDLSECHSYNNEKNGLGIQTFNRERSTLARPFLKFYDKTKECMTKSADYFDTLSSALCNEIKSNFIYRFEFTMRDKKFFDKFGLSNRLEDVLEILSTKWSEVGKTLLNTLFQVKAKRSMDTSKLKYYEQILALYLWEDRHKHNLTIEKIKIKYTSLQKNKNAKCKASKMFERIYGNVVDNSNIISDSYENTLRFDKMFGFVV